MIRCTTFWGCSGWGRRGWAPGSSPSAGRGSGSGRSIFMSCDWDNRCMPTSRRSLVWVAVVGATAALLSACGTESAPTTAQPLPTSPSSPTARTAGPTPNDEATRIGGDPAPHNVENNAWKHRPALTPSDQRIADEAARRIRPVLKNSREARDFSPAALRKALGALGYPSASIEARAFETPSWWTSPNPPPGVVYALAVGERACVFGDVRPERVLVETGGPNIETGCMPPPLTH